MKTSRFFILITFLILQISLQAQTASEVFETNWKGGSIARTDLTESGYFVCTESLYSIDYDESDNTFTGYCRTEFTLDYETYVSINKISGSFNTSDYSVVISTESSVRSDQLPNGLYWIDTSIYLTLYSDEDHSGYYILSGKSSNMSYSDEMYEVSNYPY